MTLPNLTQRVLDIAEQNELLRQHSRDLALIRGDLSRVLTALMRPAHEAAPAALDALVAAAWGAMGVRCWTVGELLSRTLTADPPGLALDAAIRATGKDGARSLGQFLARLVPPNAPHQTAGLELRRCGETHDEVLVYTIARL